MDPLPYNVTISSQTGTIQYLPIRAGDAALGWNVTYSLGTKDTGYGNLQGIGVDVHQTTHDGATMQFSWIGTAVYLYGHASGASYTLDVDGEQTSSSSVNIPQGGVLGSRTGLNYGNHTLTLTNHGIGQLAFQYAELTVGMGYPGTSIQNNTILAVDTDPVSYNPTPNPFFTYHPEYNHWGIQDAKSQLLPSGILVPVPLQMLTPTLGEAMSFTVNQTSAFFLYGSSNNNRDAKTVTITPFSDPSKARTTIVNDYSSLLDFFQIIYWEAGLDRDESYNVQLIQTGIPPGNPSGSPNFGFYSLVTVDGGSALSSQTSGTGDQHQSSTKLRTGLIVGFRSCTPINCDWRGVLGLAT
ncbi:hypothetical protein BXZ70DRAFT_179232 [Cristinia sonorae]|uniref:Uncharacterized protein n=1 Tax=Cristinia sonorae TaxID=1940300 RepID=A0A8K0UMF9_9AGAR|nr:hypothetical protein BXZ70DRAFT_179232 [Cristinia sonorae]